MLLVLLFCGLDRLFVETISSSRRKSGIAGRVIGHRVAANVAWGVLVVLDHDGHECDGLGRMESLGLDLARSGLDQSGRRLQVFCCRRRSILLLLGLLGIGVIARVVQQWSRWRNQLKVVERIKLKDMLFIGFWLVGFWLVGFWLVWTLRLGLFWLFCRLGNRRGRSRGRGRRGGKGRSGLGRLVHLFDEHGSGLAHALLSLQELCSLHFDCLLQLEQKNH